MRISSKLVLFALGCSVLPLLAVFSLSYHTARASLDATIETDLMGRASDALAALQGHLVVAKGTLSQFSRLSVMRDVALRDRGGLLESDLGRFATAEPIFREILVTDDEGRVMAATDTAALGADLRGTWEYEAPRLGIEFDGPTVTSHRLDEDIATQALPIFDPDVGNGRERVIGALIGSISWNTLERGLHGDALVGGEQGPGRQVVLQSTDDGRILYATPGLEVPPVLLRPTAEDGAFRELTTADGRTLLSASVDSVAIAPFRDPGWRLHVVLDTDIAYASVHELRGWFIRVGAGVLVLVSLLAYLLSRSITRPIEALVKAAGRLARGDDDMPLGGGERDEIGKLARSFEAMRRSVHANERELIRKTEQSEAAARLKGEFLANMSHEVRTPINGVLGMTELLLATRLDPTQSRYAEIILRSGQSLLGVINDVLDFSKIEAGKLEIQEAEFDVRELIEDVFEMVAESGHRKGLELALDMPPGSHVAYRGDANRIRQVLLNLLGNAIKFTERGDVRLEVRTGEPDSVVAGREAAPGDRRVGVSMTVIDTGIGIPEPALAGIFDSFVQGDGSTTRRFGGTGLGLAISSRLARLMGGDIGVHSTLGEGSRFELHVPLEALPASVADAWHLPDALKGCRVLVVDDNACNREILETQMRFWGATPTTANHGAEALDVVLRAGREGRPFDLAVLDMQMPGMSGMELADALQADGRLGRAPIVLLGSVCDQLDPSACRAAGIDSVITKPVRQPELYRCVSALLGGGRQEELAVRRPLTPERLVGRVLLADDHPTNRFMMTEMLRRIGLDVVVADHGQAAIEALEDGGYEANGFDVVLMDCQMPVLDGFAATREIRRRERTVTDRRRMPVIALTANALQGDREVCLEAGMDDYLSKPVTAASLVARLSTRFDFQPTSGARSTAASGAGDADDGPAVPAGASSAGGSAVSPPALDSIVTEAREPVCDRRVYDDLVAMTDGARAGLFDDLFATFRRTAVEDLDGVRGALAAGDAAALASFAHRLSSSSANWGARRFAARCAAVENAARIDDLTAAALPATALAGDLADLLEEIERPSAEAAA